MIGACVSIVLRLYGFYFHNPTSLLSPPFGHLPLGFLLNDALIESTLHERCQSSVPNISACFYSHMRRRPLIERNIGYHRALVNSGG